MTTETDVDENATREDDAMMSVLLKASSSSDANSSSTCSGSSNEFKDDENRENIYQDTSSRNAAAATDDSDDGVSDEGEGEGEGIDENGVDHWRVKVYYLDGDGAWTDRGTGFATCRQVSGVSQSVAEWLNEKAN